jgi:DNA-binding MarR family transcriptional regulator
MSKPKKADMYSAQLVQIENQLTGEWEQAKLEMKVTMSKPKVTVPFTMLMQGVTLAMTKELSPSSAKLLLYLMCSTEYKNVIAKPSNFWAKELKYSIRQIDRATKELVKLGILFKEKHPVDRRIVVYSINPLQSWKGTEVDRKKIIREHPDPKQLDLFQNLPENSEEKSQYTFDKDKYIPKVVSESTKRNTLSDNKGQW